MMPGLRERIDAAKETLRTVDAALGGNPKAFPTAVGKEFQSIVADFEGQFDHWITMLEARNAARDFLDNLEGRADMNDMVPYGTAQAKFVHVRLIGVQAYLATQWALADNVTAAVGKVLCTPEFGKNPTMPAKLVSHFVADGRNGKTAGILCKSIRGSFGWRIAVSYAIRNHFIHDGGQSRDALFFAASSPASGFQISEAGWRGIIAAAGKTDVNDLHDYDDGSWPASPCADLRGVLLACERATDEALGVLLGSACRTLAFHIGFMLGEA